MICNWCHQDMSHIEGPHYKCYNNDINVGCGEIYIFGTTKTTPIWVLDSEKLMIHILPNRN